MKILIVTTVSDTIYSILKGMPEFLARSHSISLCFSDDEGVQRVRDCENVDVYPVNMERGISPLKDIVSIAKMIWLLTKLKPDVVHSYTPKAGLIAMVAARIVGTKRRVHTFTGLIFPTSTGIRKKVLMWVDKLICFCATKVVPESEGVKKDLIESNITSKDLAVIGHGNIAGVDIEHFDSSNEELVIKTRGVAQRLGVSSGFVFSYVGRLNRDKGISELYQAFEKLTFDAKLVVVGDIDAVSPPESAVLARMTDDARVLLVGYQDDVRPYICCSNVLVLPSYREGFPNVVLQALALAKPVIVTDVSGANEVVSSENGWVVPIKDVEALVAAMNEAFFVRENGLEVRGRIGRKIIEEKFERKSHYQRILSFYDGL